MRGHGDIIDDQVDNAVGLFHYFSNGKIGL